MLAGRANGDGPRRKVLEKAENAVTGPADSRKRLPGGGTIMAVVAINTATRTRVDLTALVRAIFGTDLTRPMPKGVSPTPSSGGGAFSCVHKEKEGRAIYYFANSTDDAIDTFAELRGHFVPERWDPLTGDVTALAKVDCVNREGQEHSRFPLQPKPVTATFAVGAVRPGGSR